MNKKYLSLSLAAILSTVTHAQLVIETFDGPGSPNQVKLNGSTAETFAAGIITAGGSATWSAPDSATTSYTTSGAVNSTSMSNSSAYLNLGTYINGTRGTDAGKFVFSVTLNGRPLTASWLGIAIFGSAAVTNANFTANDSTAAMIYRSTGDIDPFANGTANQPTEDGAFFTGSQTLTMSLDLTTAGGYNGTNNFGTIAFAVGTTSLGSVTYTTLADADFQYIGLTQAAATGGDGYYSNLTLTQIPEPESFALLAGAFALTGVMIRRRRA